MSLLLSGWVGLFAFLGANSAYGTFEELQDEWVPDTRAMQLNLPDLSRVSRVYADSGEVLRSRHRHADDVAEDLEGKTVAGASGLRRQTPQVQELRRGADEWGSRLRPL